PVSKISDDLIVSNPYFLAPSPTFKKPFDLEIKCGEKDAKIYYTLDGSIPTASSALYTNPITISSTTTVKAIAIKDGKSSFVDQGTFTKIRDDIKLTLLTKYLPNYPAQGDETLIDGIRGTQNWRLGRWQGYQGNDLVAVIDMGAVKPVKTVSLGTLQDSQSWVVFPKYVEYWTSDDNKNYKLAATVKTETGIEDIDIQTQEFKASLNTTTRYIKIIAKQYGTMPESHPDKGKPSYIFADEITIE
ncbi:MAG TPA: chitobiase/beta-hexosaminidase C-terminal domain-containing protein, partial [Mucilaginibacter sp.]